MPDATHESSHRIADIRVVSQLIAYDMSVAEFGDEQQPTSTSAESNVDEHASNELARYNRASYRVTDGKFRRNARPQFRVLVTLWDCTVAIVDSLGPLTEGFTTLP